MHYWLILDHLDPSVHVGLEYFQENIKLYFAIHCFFLTIESLMWSRGDCFVNQRPVVLEGTVAFCVCVCEPLMDPITSNINKLQLTTNRRVCCTCMHGTALYVDQQVCFYIVGYWVSQRLISYGCTMSHVSQVKTLPLEAYEINNIGD